MIKFKKNTFIIIFIYIAVISTIFISCTTPKDNVEKQSQKQTYPLIESKQSTAQPSPNPEPVKQEEPLQEDNKIIGSFNTDILDKTKARTHNLNLTLEKINGHIVKPNEIFSFNQVVGERIPEKGFEKAIIFKETGDEYETGGGICQVSSTLYNACIDANMEVLERHSHSKEIHYLPLGQDAAVYYGSLDFKFKNVTDTPIKLEAYIKDDKMTVSILKSE